MYIPKPNEGRLLSDPADTHLKILPDTLGCLSTAQSQLRSVITSCSGVVRQTVHRIKMTSYSSGWNPLNPAFYWAHYAIL